MTLTQQSMIQFLRKRQSGFAIIKISSTITALELRNQNTGFADSRTKVVFVVL